MIPSNRLKPHLILLLLLIMHLVFLINTKFTLWPEMVVYPYLLNNGFTLYKDIINPYPPLLTYALSIFTKIFGYSPLSYQILTAIVILFADLLIFLTTLMLSKSLPWAALSLLFFTVVSIAFDVNGLWFDLFQTPLVILAFYNLYLFLKKRKENNLAISFVLLTVAYFIKQQVVWLVIWFLLILVYKKLFTRKLIKIALLPPVALGLLFFALIFIYFLQQDAGNNFLFWTVTFPYTRASSMPGYLLMPTARQLILLVSLFFITSPILFRKNSFQNLAYLTAIVLTLFAYPRFDYFHLVPTLALLAIGLGSGVLNKLEKSVLIKILCVTAALYLGIFGIRYFKNNWHKDTRFFEKDIILAAQNLSKLTEKNDLVYIQNGPDQLLPLSSRLPPKPWADEFPWYLELQGAQQKIVDSLKMQRVQYVVYTPYETSETFTLGSYRPKIIADYLDANYTNFVKLSEDLSLKKKLIKDDDTKSADKP